MRTFLGPPASSPAAPFASPQRSRNRREDAGGPSELILNAADCLTNPHSYGMLDAACTGGDQDRVLGACPGFQFA